MTTPIIEYVVISPDGFTIDHCTYPTPGLARAALKQWTKRYRAQGYYSNASRERIPLAELTAHCRITCVDPELPTCPCGASH